MKNKLTRLSTSVTEHGKTNNLRTTNSSKILGCTKNNRIKQMHIPIRFRINYLHVSSPKTEIKYFSLQFYQFYVGVKLGLSPQQRM